MSADVARVAFLVSETCATFAAHASPTPQCAHGPFPTDLGTQLPIPLYFCPRAADGRGLCCLPVAPYQANRPTLNALTSFFLLLVPQTGEAFAAAADAYLRVGLSRGVPSLFADVRPLLRDEAKRVTLLRRVMGYKESLER